MGFADVTTRAANPPVPFGGEPGRRRKEDERSSREESPPSPPSGFRDVPEARRRGKIHDLW